MNNIYRKRMISDLLKSMIVMLIGLPMATGLLYLLMLAFSHAPAFSIDRLAARTHASHIKKHL
ncbi:MAG: hypothetical protein JSU01_22545 [Bacteroidetes bacterium]|nr:hypothetical protein [Bacteroidota bacterium]